MCVCIVLDITKLEDFCVSPLFSNQGEEVFGQIEQGNENKSCVCVLLPSDK